MDQGLIVLYDGTLNDLKVPGLIQDTVTDGTGFSDGTPIIVMAHDFSDTVKDKFAKTTKSGLTIIPVKTPRSGLPNGASLFLLDMAAYTGGKVYDPGNVHDMDEDGIGHFDSARVNMYETFIITIPNPDAIQGRIVELKAIAESAFSELDRSFIRAAIAKLTGGVSTIMVGGSSDLEIRERKARVEDAVEAVRSAIAEGIITGGCSVQLMLADRIRKHPNIKPSWDILATALIAPFQHLLENCGEDVNLIWPEIQKHITNRDELPKVIFDAEEHTYVDPLEAGIIEPTKVCRVAIGNALSVAALLITLGGIVVVPRDVGMEQQVELADRAFKNMMQEAGQ
jgi:chaperonin GroEL